MCRGGWPLGVHSTLSLSLGPYSATFPCDGPTVSLGASTDFSPLSGVCSPLTCPFLVTAP